MRLRLTGRQSSCPSRAGLRSEYMCRHQRILQALCWHSPRLGVEQVVRHYDCSLRTAELSLDALVREGYLCSEWAQVPPILKIGTPLFCGGPNEPEPNCGHLSYIARQRWQYPPK